MVMKRPPKQLPREAIDLYFPIHVNVPFPRTVIVFYPLLRTTSVHSDRLACIKGAEISKMK